jgi:hypothetical protein
VDTVLERLGTTESTMLSVSRGAGGKVRVTSVLWHKPKVILKDEVLVIRNVDGRLQLARMRKYHDDWNPKIELTIRMALVGRWSTTTASLRRRMRTSRSQARTRMTARKILNNKERAALSYFRIHRRMVSVTDDQLDALEVRGYLDPDRRGDRADERDAIESR